MGTQPGRCGGHAAGQGAPSPSPDQPAAPPTHTYMPRRRRGVLPMLAATLAQPRPAPAAAAPGAAAGVVVVVSGKRKSGKDFVCERLLDQLGAAALRAWAEAEG